MQTDSSETFDPAFRLLPGESTLSAAAVRAQIQSWIQTPWLGKLTRMFGGSVSGEGDLGKALTHLEQFSERWDFRRMARSQGVSSDDSSRGEAGAARWLTSASGFTGEMEREVRECATHLGLTHAEEPRRRVYDYVLVLGGARLSCQLRAQRAAEVLRDGVGVHGVGLLGAARPVGVSERDATDLYAPGAADEFDLAVAGGMEAFDFDPAAGREERFSHPSNPNLSWAVKRFEAYYAGQPLQFIAVSAPSSEPDKRRANSADTLSYFVDREAVSAGNWLLLITSQIYVPYVQLEALRVLGLPRHLLIETIGFPGDRMIELQGMSNASHYLQELRSVIQAAARFCRSYPP